MVELIHPHWEALTFETRNAFTLLSQQPLINDYYLAGGTGLALHLGHRFSADLDFFSSEKNSVSSEQRSALRHLLDETTLEITHDRDMTFVANWRGVGISFFQLTDYPLVEPPLMLKGVKLASVSEIGAMKLSAIIGRGTRKDLVDLYYILQHETLESIFRIAARKYPQARSFGVSAIRAMAYFEDAEKLPMPQMLERTPWKTMKSFLQSQALEAGRVQLSDLWE